MIKVIFVLSNIQLILVDYSSIYKYILLPQPTSQRALVVCTCANAPHPVYLSSVLYNSPQTFLQRCFATPYFAHAKNMHQSICFVCAHQRSDKELSRLHISHLHIPRHFAGAKCADQPISGVEITKWK